MNKKPDIKLLGALLNANDALRAVAPDDAALQDKADEVQEQILQAHEQTLESGHD